MNNTLELNMNSSGEVIFVKVLKTSGNVYFDRAAEKAVMAASPLPVPTD